MENASTCISVHVSVSQYDIHMHLIYLPVYLSACICLHSFVIMYLEKYVLGRSAPRVNKVNKRQPSVLMVYFMLHIRNHYLFTNWRPFSLIKQQKILQNCNTVMMAIVDALILMLMFSQWSLISCTRGCCSWSLGFLWHLTTSLIYRKSVCQALHL